VRSHARASSAGSSTRRGEGLGRVVRGVIARRELLLCSNGSGAPSGVRARLASFLLATAALAVVAAPARAAAPTHPFLPALSHEGTLGHSCGAAVDSHGDLYIAEKTSKKIKIFDPTGAPITEFEASANAAEPCDLAVDSAGNVYVNGFFEDLVKYAPGGAGYPPTPSTTYSSSGKLAEGGVVGVAVDPANDDVYVAFPSSVSSYEPDGTLISSTIAEGVGSGFGFRDVGVDGRTGNVYVVDVFTNKAYVVKPAGNVVLAEIDGADSSAGAFEELAYPALAVDQSNGHVYVSDISTHHVVDEFDSGGNFVAELSHSPALEEGFPSGLAVDNSSGSTKGTVYVTSGGEGQPGSVYAFGPLVYGHDLKVEKTGPGKGAVVGGSASRPTAIECGSFCQSSFEDGAQITLTATPDAGSRVKKWTGCDQVLGSGQSECKLTLGADRKVTLTLSAKPAIAKPSADQITTTSARLNAEVTPNLENTEYHFEYVDDGEFQANEFANATLIPIPDAEVGSGGSPVPVSEEIKGLSPFTTYHFRVVATNAAGVSESDPASFTTFIVPEGFESCPNDSLRTGPSAALPDCRAYEQASPVDKNGGDAIGTVLSAKASVDGNRVSFEGYSPLPGADGSQEFDPPYLATRGSNGWSSQGLLPPEALAHIAQVSAWTPDFSHVYDWTWVFGEPDKWGLYDRNTNDRSIAPVIANTDEVGRADVTGTSDDGSVVFFESEGAPLTPNATPQRPNLYVWDRETGTVSLAGVFNDEEAPARGSFAGAFDWDRGITGVGGAETFMYTRDQHTNSSDGSSVYFTSGNEAQLYLRVNPTQPQSEVVTNGEGEEECTEPELACTIHVSGTEKDNSPTGLEGADPAGPHAATFLGATPDGKHTFFTSTEMLTNDANTGPEQPPAQIGTAKIGESGAVEAEDESFLPKHALGLAVDPAGEYIYWADPSKATIGRAKLPEHEGEPPTEINDEFITPGPTQFEMHPKTDPGALEAVPSAPRYVAVNDEYVYWTNSGPRADGVEFEYGSRNPPVDLAGTIGRAKLTESGPTEVKPEFIPGASDPQGIAVDGEHIYWSTFPQFEAHGRHAVARATLQGAGVNRDFCANSDLNIPHERIDGMALVGGEAFLVENEGNFVHVIRANLAACERTGSVGIEGALSGIAVVGTHLYWANSKEGKIGRTTLSTFDSSPNCFAVSTCESEVIKLEGSPFGIASDGEHLYWSVNGEAPSNAGNDLYRYDYEGHGDGGKLTDLTADSNPGDPNGAEVYGVLGNSDDGSTVYFVANGVLAEGASRGSCHGRYAAGGDVSGVCNLYVSHNGEVAFIAQIGNADNWRFRAHGGEAGNQPKVSRVSSDGSTVLFTSGQRFDTDAQLYRYQIGDSGPLCISCPPTGVPATNSASLGNAEIGGVSALEPHAAMQNHNLSPDGNRVVFQTTEALVGADTNGLEGCPNVGEGHPACTDVYEWEAKGTGSCHWEKQNGGCIYLISSGRSTEPSVLLDASASGNDVFFFTRSQLVGQDEDSFVDVYDARVDGGFASQKAPPPPPICEGEACKGGIPPAPEVGSPSTPLFSGPGNPKPHHKKAKARKHKHKRKAHKRHAKHNRRAHR
jgi:hypothetical protein